MSAAFRRVMQNVSGMIGQNAERNRDLDNCLDRAKTALPNVRRVVGRPNEYATPSGGALKSGPQARVSPTCDLTSVEMRHAACVRSRIVEAYARIRRLMTLQTRLWLGSVALDARIRLGSVTLNAWVRLRLVGLMPRARLDAGVRLRDSHRNAAHHRQDEACAN